MTKGHWIAPCVGALALLSACDDPVRTKPPASVEGVPNAEISAAVGTSVPLQVRVLDSGGKPAKGVPVAWAAQAGTVDPASTSTDQRGIAAAVWTLGTTTGPQSASATASGLSPVTFTASATPGPVASLALAPAADTLDPGQKVRLSVTAKDRFGNSVPDATVSFSSSDTTIAMVDTTGLVQARFAGAATITAAGGGQTGTMEVSVRPVMAMITSGNAFSTCGLSRRGESYCWGINTWGNLGNGSSSPAVHPTPAPVAGGLGFVALSAGPSHTCGIIGQGEAYCWGWNEFGELGATSSEMCGHETNRKPCSTTPLRVSGELSFRSISAGSFHSTCGLTTDGRAYCWGLNASGQLGNGSTINSTTPVPVSGGMTFASIDVGSDHACAITPSGEAYCWGDNGSGQLGFRSSIAGAPEPVIQVAGGRYAFASVRAGYLYTCGITLQGQAYCWGSNGVGQGGSGTTSTVNYDPVLVAGDHRFALIETGQNHTCAVDAQGALYCWGYNDRGQLGDGTTASSYAPAAVSGGRTFGTVAVGRHHSCALALDGQAYCWGLNRNGQLGTGTTQDSNVPVQVTGFGP